MYEAANDPIFDTAAAQYESLSGCKDHGQKGDKDGYGRTVRVLDSKRLYMRMHRAVFLDTYGFLPECVKHKCDNPRCINPNHLEAGTVASNNTDRATRGRNADVSGERNPMCKLDDLAVDDIRRSSRPPKELAEAYGVNVRHIYRIRSGERR